jgi:diguanylate cyclase
VSFILVVDDQTINREFLVTLLGYGNYTLQEAVDGKDALEKAKKNKPELVITDLFMPLMNGYDLAQQMRADPDLKDVPIIFYTATYRLEEAQLLADSCNVKWVLSKPCEPEVILDTVSKALNCGNAALPIKDRPVQIELKREKRLNQLQKSQKSLRLSEHVSKYLKNADPVKEMLAIFLNGDQGKNAPSSKQTADDFLQNVEKLHQFNEQLFSLTMLNLELISEKDINKLTHLFSVRARAILKTGCCGFFLLNNQGIIVDYFVVGENDTVLKLDPDTLENSFIRTLIENKGLTKISSVDPVMLPKKHPKIQSLIGISLHTTSRVYGGFYLCNKSDNTSFNDDDELILHILAAEIAVLIENIELYTIIQRHATTLQLEISERKNTEIELTRSEKLFRQFAENIDDVFWLITPNLDKILYVSPAYEEIWQRDRQEIYDNPPIWLNSVIEQDRKKVMDAFMPNKDNMSTHYRIERPDGSIRKIYAKGFLLKDKHGQVENKIGIATDIIEFEKYQQRNLIQSEVSRIISGGSSLQTISTKLLKTTCKILDCIVGEIWLLDDKSTLYCLDIWSVKNDVLKSLLDERWGLSYASGVGLPGKILQSKKSHWVTDIDVKNYQDINFVKTFKIKTIFGSPIIFQEKVIGLLQFFFEEKLLNDPLLLNLIEWIGLQLGDFISHSHTAEQLNYIVKHDILTDFLNRSTWEEELNTLITAKKPDFIAIFLFEIDRFKLIIDTIGHDGADDLLRLIANKIQQNITTPTDLLARISLDKFTIALSDVQTIEQVHYFASRLMSLFKIPLVVKGKEIFITMSIGISLFPENGLESKYLLVHADSALDRSKEQGGNSYNIFNPKKETPLLGKLDLENRLRQALFSNQFVLYYQPQVDLKSNKITGFEALIRWQHPERGLVCPGEFLPILEQSDLIATVGEWVLREACSQIIRHNVPIAVNLSIFQFRPRYNLVNFVRQLVKETGINPALLDLEITEGIMIEDVTQSLEILKELRTLGIRFSLDDFGTGYCSLNYLKHFSVDRVKIDKSFIEGLPHAQNNKAITSAILALAHGLGMKVIAEGVETKEQLKFLWEAGCDEIQGYYYSKPLPASEIEAFIKNASFTLLK